MIRNKIIREIDGKTSLEKIINDSFKLKLRTKSVKTTIDKEQLRWLGHVHRMSDKQIPKPVFEVRMQKHWKTRKTEANVVTRSTRSSDEKRCKVICRD